MNIQWYEVEDGFIKASINDFVISFPIETFWDNVEKYDANKREVMTDSRYDERDPAAPLRTGVIPQDEFLNLKEECTMAISQFLEDELFSLINLQSL